jgi:hypothetical protein
MAATSRTKGETLRAANISPLLWDISVPSRPADQESVILNKDKRLSMKLSKRLS